MTARPQQVSCTATDHHRLVHCFDFMLTVEVIQHLILITSRTPLTDPSQVQPHAFARTRHQPPRHHRRGRRRRLPSLGLPRHPRSPILPDNATPARLRPPRPDLHRRHSLLAHPGHPHRRHRHRGPQGRPQDRRHPHAPFARRAAAGRGGARHPGGPVPLRLGSCPAPHRATQQLSHITNREIGSAAPSSSLFCRLLHELAWKRRPMPNALPARNKPRWRRNNLMPRGATG